MQNLGGVGPKDYEHFYKHLEEQLPLFDPADKTSMNPWLNSNELHELFETLKKVHGNALDQPIHESNTEETKAPHLSGSKLKEEEIDQKLVRVSKQVMDDVNKVLMGQFSKLLR